MAVILVGGGRQLTMTAGCLGLPPAGPRCLPAVAVSSTGSAHRPEWWFAAFSTAAEFSGVSLPGPGIIQNITAEWSKVGVFVGVLGQVGFTSRYFCSVLASRVNHASTVLLLLRRVGSRSCRSAGGSVAKLDSWAVWGWGAIRVGD